MLCCIPSQASLKYNMLAHSECVIQTDEVFKVQWSGCAIHYSIYNILTHTEYYIGGFFHRAVYRIVCLEVR